MTNLTYLFDPLCGWCYGATSVIAELAEREGIKLRLIPTGLFSGDGARMMDDNFAGYAWSNDQRIAKLTGQVFSDDYRRKVLGGNNRLFDSAPATLALSAVYLNSPDHERIALKAIQKARYVDGKDITDIAVLSEILSAAGLDEAAQNIISPDAKLLAANQDRLDEAQTLLNKFGLTGVPVLIVGEGQQVRLIKTNALFGNINDVIAQL